MREDNTLMGNWANSISLSGVIFQRPYIKKILRGSLEMEIATFILAQPNYNDKLGKEFTKRIYCTTFAKKVIETLKTIETQTTVTCLGMLGVKKKTSGGVSYINYYPQIEEIKLCDVLRSPLEEYTK